MERFVWISHVLSIHEGTKCTSYKLVFSKLVCAPSSKPLSLPDKLKTYDNYLIKLVKELPEMRIGFEADRTQEKASIVGA